MPPPPPALLPHQPHSEHPTHALTTLPTVPPPPSLTTSSAPLWTPYPCRYHPTHCAPPPPALPPHQPYSEYPTHALTSLKTLAPVLTPYPCPNHPTTLPPHPPHPTLNTLPLSFIPPYPGPTLLYKTTPSVAAKGAQGAIAHPQPGEQDFVYLKIETSIC